jgi:hypothetical protein
VLLFVPGKVGKKIECGLQQVQQAESLGSCVFCTVEQQCPKGSFRSASQQLKGVELSLWPVTAVLCAEQQERAFSGCAQHPLIVLLSIAVQQHPPPIKHRGASTKSANNNLIAREETECMIIDRRRRMKRPLHSTSTR